MGEREDFLEACKKGNRGKILRLLGTKVSADMCDFGDSEGTTVLMYACNSGRVDVVKLLLENGAKVNMQNKKGMTSLHIACNVGNADMVKMLIDYGADATIADNGTGNCALHWAVAKNNVRIVEILLDTGIDINITSSIGATSLHFACLIGSKKMVSLLLDRGANIDAVCDRIAVGLTPLHLACMYLKIDKNGRQLIEEKVMRLDSTTVMHPVFSDDINVRREVVKMLVDRGANINIKTISNFRAVDLTNDKDTIAMLQKQAKVNEDSLEECFLRACSIGNVKKVNNCICGGVDINIKNENGSTPLICASFNGHKDVVDILLENGAQIDNKDNYGKDALFYASIGDHKDIVKALLINGADIESKEIESYSLLTCMCVADNKEMVDLFIENGADINWAVNGITDLMFACMKNNVSTVEALLEYGADPDKKDDCGRTALHIACFKGRKKIVELLIKNGADVNAKDVFEEMPIEFACKENNYNVVGELIRGGCDIKEHIAEWIVNSCNAHLIKMLAGRDASMYRYVVRRLIKNIKDEDKQDKDKQSEILSEVQSEWRGLRHKHSKRCDIIERIDEKELNMLTKYK